jgi:D-sedoheptulose 7-phosphate isomerase
MQITIDPKTGMWTRYVADLAAVLGGLAFTRADGSSLGVDDGYAIWRDLTLEVRARRRTVYLVGNGASASIASHFAADLAKNGRVHTQTFCDLSLITAIANDIAYDQVFAEPLRGRGEAGDMLVGISSSGKSPNVLAAAVVAAELGITVVTVTGKDPGNPLRRRGDLNLHVPAPTYGLTETAHAACLHRWMDLVQMADGELA